MGRRRRRDRCRRGCRPPGSSGRASARSGAAASAAESRLRAVRTPVLYSLLRSMRIEYREEPCKSALNPVRGMGFKWSLNPYMGCVHRCTYCYVRAYERRADRPSDDRYGTSIRVKINIADVLRVELARASWRREVVAIGAATDVYQPAEGHYRITRACLGVLAHARTPASIVTR